MNYIVTAEQVRAYLLLNNASASSKYSDQTIGSNIEAAQSDLEQWCHRFFYDHPGTTWAGTTQLQATMSIPGFRSFDSIVWGASAMTIATPYVQTEDPSIWGLLEPTVGVPDGKALVTALQFRPWRVDNDRPWYYADPGWWDKGLDNPFYPGNYGGGYAYTSMPNDLIIVGDGGYAPGEEPAAVKDAVKILAAWKTVRSASMLAGVSLSPGGTPAEYGDMPQEVYRFIAGWKIGRQAASVG